MKDIGTFRKKKLYEYMKHNLFSNIQSEIISDINSKETEFDKFIENLIETKLLTEFEKYLRNRPFIRTIKRFVIVPKKLGVLLDGSYSFSVTDDRYKIPIPNALSETSTAKHLDLSNRILDMCNESEKDYIKDCLISLFEKKKELKKFLHIPPLIAEMRTVGQLYDYNEEFYNRLVKLYPDKFNPLDSVDNLLKKLRNQLGFC